MIEISDSSAPQQLSFFTWFMSLTLRNSNKKHNSIYSINYYSSFMERNPRYWFFLANSCSNSILNLTQVLFFLNLKEIQAILWIFWLTLVLATIISSVRRTILRLPETVSKSDSIHFKMFNSRSCEIVKDTFWYLV